MIKVFLFPRGAKCLHLHGGDHVHVIDPETRLTRQPLRRGILPLPGGKKFSQIKIFLLLSLNVDLERNRAENCEVHVPVFLNEIRPRRSEQWAKTLDESGRKI